MAEGGGLLNRYTVKSRIGGSNPPLSASLNFATKIPRRPFPFPYWAHSLAAPNTRARSRFRVGVVPKAAFSAELLKAGETRLDFALKIQTIHDNKLFTL